jgi:hypothetical protein
MAARARRLARLPSAGGLHSTAFLSPSPRNAPPSRLRFVPPFTPSRRVRLRTGRFGSGAGWASRTRRARARPDPADRALPDGRRGRRPASGLVARLSAACAAPRVRWHAWPQAPWTGALLDRAACGVRRLTGRPAPLRWAWLLRRLDLRRFPADATGPSLPPCRRGRSPAEVRISRPVACPHAG